MEARYSAKIISKANDGEYEGFINFSNPYSQFLMIKGAGVWNIATTFYYIGASKFGFGGDMFSVPGGAGIYKFNASTNTNIWSCTKINSWNVYGTAVSTDGNTDAQMTQDEGSLTWRITRDFSKGEFVFRANKSNTIVMGHNANSEAGVPDYNGTKISIPKAGNYTMELSLQDAGNYAYSLQKNN